jgi:hypothetical protein
MSPPPPRFTSSAYRPPNLEPSHRTGTSEDARLAMEDERADDPVAKAWRSPSIGPMELQRLLSVLAARRQTVDADLRRLIAAAETLGMLDIVVRARNILLNGVSEEQAGYRDQGA